MKATRIIRYEGPDAWVTQTLAKSLQDGPVQEPWLGFLQRAGAPPVDPKAISAETVPDGSIVLVLDADDVKALTAIFVAADDPSNFWSATPAADAAAAFDRFGAILDRAQES